MNKLLAKIHNAMDAGNSVQVTTHAKATIYSPYSRDRFVGLSNGDIAIKHGKALECITTMDGSCLLAKLTIVNKS